MLAVGVNKKALSCDVDVVERVYGRGERGETQASSLRSGEFQTGKMIPGNEH
jgi:hypothetical protein